VLVGALLYPTSSPSLTPWPTPKEPMLPLWLWSLDRWRRFLNQSELRLSRGYRQRFVFRQHGHSTG
jgi:hypothetical protein